MESAAAEGRKRSNCAFCHEPRETSGSQHRFGALIAVEDVPEQQEGDRGPDQTLHAAEARRALRSPEEADTDADHDEGGDLHRRAVRNGCSISVLVELVSCCFHSSLFSSFGGLEVSSPLKSLSKCEEVRKNKL